MLVRPLMTNFKMTVGADCAVSAWSRLFLSINSVNLLPTIDYKESWAQKNWCFWTVVLEKTLESPVDCEEIQPVHPEGDQSWVFIGRTDVETETPILWPPDAKSWLIWKDPDAGKDWGQEEKGMTEDEMVGWHHRLNGDRFGWTLGVDDRQGGLVYCSLWSCKESDTTERLNWTELAHWLSMVGVGWKLTFGQTFSPSQLVASEIKKIFLSINLACLLAFERQAVGLPPFSNMLPIFFQELIIVE